MGASVLWGGFLSVGVVGTGGPLFWEMPILGHILQRFQGQPSNVFREVPKTQNPCSVWTL